MIAFTLKQEGDDHALPVEEVSGHIYNTRLMLQKFLNFQMGTISRCALSPKCFCTALNHQFPHMLHYNFFLINKKKKHDGGL